MVMEAPTFIAAAAEQYAEIRTKAEALWVQLDELRDLADGVFADVAGELADDMPTDERMRMHTLSGYDAAIAAIEGVGPIDDNDDA